MSPASARILVVDDQHDVCEVIAESLRSVGHEAVMALDASAMYAALERESFDLAIIDMVVPGAPQGEHVEHAVAKGVRVIVTSGYPELIEDPPPRLRFLPKPFSSKALLDSVARALVAPVA